MSEMDNIKDLAQKEEEAIKKAEDATNAANIKMARQEIFEEAEKKLNNAHISENEEAKILQEYENAAKETEAENIEETESVVELDDDVDDTKDEQISSRLENLTKIRSASRKEKKSLYNDDYIIPIGDKLETSTRESSRYKDFLILAESKQVKKIVTATIDSITELNQMAAAVCHIGDYKIYIPAHELIGSIDEYLKPTTDAHVAKENRTRIKALVNRRLGSEIDFIIKGIDENGLFAIGSRLEAMMIKRQSYLLYRDRNGNFAVNEGDVVEARVCATQHYGITIEVFGVECVIPVIDLSYNRIYDVTQEFSPGEKIIVKLTKLNREIVKGAKGKRVKVSVKASVKEAYPDPRREAFNSYKKDDLVRSYVSGVTEYGVYVRLGGENGKIDALCRFPDKIACPNVGDIVQVKITHTEEGDCKIYGYIQYCFAHNKR